MVTARQGWYMTVERKRLLYQLSVVLTVSIIFVPVRSVFFLISLITSMRSKRLSLTLIFFSASIFAYGQTSSGKTYTMIGITEYTVADIYDYVQKVRKCCMTVLKFRIQSCSLFPRSKSYIHFLLYSMKKEHLF